MPEHHTSFNDGNPIFNGRNALVLTAVDLGCRYRVFIGVSWLQGPGAIGLSGTQNDWQSQTPDNGNQLKLARTERRGKGFGNYDLTATGILDDSEQRNHTLLVDGGAFERTWINRAEAIGEADDSIGAAFLVGILR
jgi:hypothetical protein